MPLTKPNWYAPSQLTLFLYHARPGSLQLIAVLWIFGIAVLDALLDNHVSLGVAYILPCMLAAWSGKFHYCIWFILLSLSCLIFDGIVFGNPYATNSQFFLDALTTLFVLTTVTYLTLALRRQQDYLHNNATHDTLTGILNRRGFREHIEIESGLLRRGNHPCVLSMIDCDNFKTVNDTLGHHTGDQVLITVAMVLRENLRRGDFCARLGGDEFVVWLPNTSENEAATMLDRFNEKLLSAMHSRQWPISFSIGSAAFPQFPENIEWAIEQADLLMYQVKNHSKNGIAITTISVK